MSEPHVMSLDSDLLKYGLSRPRKNGRIFTLLESGQRGKEYANVTGD
jgi:hypothetical protein